MSIHIKAEKGQIADRILLPGDPLRAKYIAENFLENAECYNTVRGMLGYTGIYKGKCVSVQGTGMGIPSIGIYAYELINFYDVKRLIRIGTCGSMSENFNLMDVVFAQAAATDSGTAFSRFGTGLLIPPVADFSLLRQGVEVAEKLGITPKVGTVFSTELFYDDSDNPKKLLKYGIACHEMECAELFTLGSKFNVQTLGIVTVSDLMYCQKGLTPEQREKSLKTMIEIALETV